MVDVVYIAASARDARYARTCVSSVRRYYPDVPIRLLIGGPLQRGLEDELRRWFGVTAAPLPRVDYGWGFVKLEPLFMPAGERFLVLDADTVLTGPVLDHARAHDVDFIVDDERPSDEVARAIYFDAARAGRDGSSAPPPEFLFNSGQWFGRSGLVERTRFDGLVTWGTPPRLARPDVFKNGEQGVLNFVLNEETRAGRVRTARVPLMRWPGHGMGGIDAASVAAGTGPSRVVHWAGMKAARLQDLVGGDVLAYYEARYYAKLPAGTARRVWNGGRSMLTHALGRVEARLRGPR